jgi:FMN reductase
MDGWRASDVEASPVGGAQALGIVGTASSTGRTRAVVEAVLAGAGELEADTEVIVLGEHAIPVADGTRAEDQPAEVRSVLEAVDVAQAVVIGTPVYRASFSGILKSFLDLVPRGAWDGAAQPLRAKPVVVVATGATAHHFLALDQLVGMLTGFFAAFVIPPTIYAAHDDFDSDGQLDAVLRRRAQMAGRGLVEMHHALEGSSDLRSVEPQV